MGNSQPSGIAYFNPLITSGIQGTVMFRPEKNGGTYVSVKLSGLPPDVQRALHIHASGDLTNGCASCGGHFNPDNTTHGSYLYPDRPRHAGDLINNVTSDENGDVCVAFVTRMFRVQEVVGRAIVLHKLPDDLGLKGIMRGDKFVPYAEMDLDTLRRLVLARGYYDKAQLASIPREELVHKMIVESTTSGNGGPAIGCAIIGRVDRK